MAPLDLAALTRLAARLGGGEARDARRLSGGASQESWALAVGGERFVLRRAPPGGRVSELQAGLAAEAALIEAAGRQDVPVPPLVCVLHPEDGLGEGFVTRFIDGETIGGRVLRSAALADARPRLPGEFGRILARVHAIPPAELPPLREAGVAASLDDLARAVAEDGTPRPVFALALRWLSEHCPAEVPPRLVHGDFRLGNLMIGPEGVRAVLDWELAHLGDPAEDLGWACVTAWRFGAVELPVAGLGPRQALWAGYEAGGGGAVDPARARWWEVAGTLRWGTMCAGMVRVFQDGRDRSPERAVIARRASENEADLLRMLTLGD